MQRTRVARSLVFAIPIALVILGLVTVDSVRPFKEPYLTSASRANAINKAAQEYAVAVNTVLPENCGILQLPYMAYPENGPVNKVNDYDHFWTSLANPEKSWSYGAVKNTDASIWAAQLPNVPSNEQLEILRAGGFCAIHLDTRGLDAPSRVATADDLTARLGAPVATGLKGKWQLYDLANIAPTGPTPSKMQVDAFFHQPLVTADPATFTPRESALQDSWWWATAPESTLTITPTNAEYPVTRISGSVGATRCGATQATLTITSSDRTQITQVNATPGSKTEFELPLEQGTSSPIAVTLSTSTPGCPESGGEHYAQVFNIEAR